MSNKYSEYRDKDLILIGNNALEHLGVKPFSDVEEESFLENIKEVLRRLDE